MHKTLAKIASDIDALIADASEDHPIDPHTLHVIARRIEAQAEMVEQGLQE